MRYFLNFEKLKVIKLYESDFLEMRVNLPLHDILNMPVIEGFPLLKKQIEAITLPDVKNLHLIFETDLEKVDFDDFHLITNVYLERIITSDKMFKDYLDIPRKLTKSLIGTQKALMRIINYPVKYENLQITIVDKNQNGYNLVERID